MNTLELARSLVDRGFSVFPVVYGTKVPACAKGFLDATKDESQLESWFAGREQNIGVYPGLSDCVVIDLDSYKDEANPEFEKLVAELGPLPQTYTVRTCRGGYHLYFRKPEGRDLRSYNNQLAKGVDVRGTGGYVLSEGSEVRNAPQGELLPYTVFRDLPLADLPEAWAIRWESLNVPKPKNLAELNSNVRVIAGSYKKDVDGVEVQLADGWRVPGCESIRLIKRHTLKELMVFVNSTVPV